MTDHRDMGSRSMADHSRGSFDKGKGKKALDENIEDMIRIAK